MTRVINPVSAGDIVVARRESSYTMRGGLTVPTQTYTVLRVTAASLTGKATRVSNGIRTRAVAPSREQVFTLPAHDLDAARRLVGQSFGSKQDIREALDSLINANA